MQLCIERAELARVLGLTWRHAGMSLGIVLLWEIKDGQDHMG